MSPVEPPRLRGASERLRPLDPHVRHTQKAMARFASSAKPQGRTPPIRVTQTRAGRRRKRRSGIVRMVGIRRTTRRDRSVLKGK